MHGWLILDKPLGLGSTQAVGAVKRALRTAGQGKVKVGHGGTLDPLASGVLPIALGEATKLAGRMLDSDKVYEFTCRFGGQTDTLDAEGKVIATSDRRPTPAQIEAVLPRFTGRIDQVPPAYSALKIDGARAYDLARAGEEVVPASRAVTVHSLYVAPAEAETAAFGAPASSSNPAAPASAGATVDAVTLIAHVSKGTYIRSLARDIALALGTVGHVTYLRRIRAGPFDLSHAISLDKLNEAAMARVLEHCILPLRAGLDDIPALSLDPDQAGALRQGRVLAGIAEDDGLRFATLGDTPVALVDVAGGEARIVRGFNL
ncbi:tRNA pseudouridine(55) synthase TruB [uncultured Sphingomonas sp.]|uniref:tRNA pseudouridine(55) synthase TruB n=1 Tax=uncultured Sphingomonas sp. TaxID=158754 RepID=UPI0035CB2768